MYLSNCLVELHVCSDSLRSSRVVGKVLNIVEGVDDLKDLGIPGLQARLLFSQISTWKANGVERALLVPQPTRVNKPTRKPPTPPVEFDFLKFSDTKIDTVQSEEGTQFVIKKQHEKPQNGGA